MELFEKIQETVTYINRVTENYKPEIGVILGSGLGTLVDELDIEKTVAYKDIPHFPVSTVAGHKGQLLFARLKSGKRVVAMQGRFHYYEGYPMSAVTFPVFVMKALGVKDLLVSNASGGMNPNYQVGDIVFIKDHINLLPNPLIGPNDERFGERFPSMHNAYDKELLQHGLDTAARMGIKVHTGVYVGTTGPTFETPSEYRYFRVIGGDAVGMSTVPEVIIANYLGMKVMGLSVISDLGGGEVVLEVSHEEVLAAVEKTVSVLVGLVKEILETL
ncbi:MAG: purine-nucleoside phosphorylase [Bacteroides sp.]|nr:purine-nucleoside phosphorylase [Bacteroides sp.]MCM1086477.1 purine-nucleoside phosphorylase [Bacteroides sp.]MCM1169741.1 purine-nucleoside phosphorylase [Bacteroides sp.]